VDTVGRMEDALAQPDVKPPDPAKGGLPVPQLALIAAEVSYAFDNMEDAQRRFASLIERYPGEAEILLDAVPLYLQTFLHLDDQAGYQAATDKIRKQVEAASQAASDPKAKAAYAKSGHKGPITLVVIQRDPDTQIAQMLQAMLKEASIELKIEVLERHVRDYLQPPVARVKVPRCRCHGAG